LDRMVMAGVVEARGHERFACLAEALPPGDLKEFYRGIAQSEARHADLFTTLAKQYFSDEEVESRVAHFLEKDAEIIAQIPPRPALH